MCNEVVDNVFIVNVYFRFICVEYLSNFYLYVEWFSLLRNSFFKLRKCGENIMIIEIMKKEVNGGNELYFYVCILVVIYG